MHAACALCENTHMSHVARLTAQGTRHTSHVTRHTYVTMCSCVMSHVEVTCNRMPGMLMLLYPRCAVESTRGQYTGVRR